MNALKRGAPGLLATLAILLLPALAQAELIYGLTTQNQIVVFDSADPTNVLDGGTVGNIPTGSTLQAIDYRAGTKQLYLLDDSENVFTFDPVSFDATLVGTYTPRIPGLSYAFDFNPAFSPDLTMFERGTFARIITDANDNRVINGDTGQYLPPVEKTDVFYPVGDPNAGQDPNIAGIAYTNSLGKPTSTQQYGIDSELGILVTVANNAGTLGTVGPLFGAMTPLTNELGFDISGATGIAYAALQTNINSQLYTIDLTTGAATAISPFAGGEILRSLAVVPVPEPGSLAVLASVMLGLFGIRRR